MTLRTTTSLRLVARTGPAQHHRCEAPADPSRPIASGERGGAKISPRLLDLLLGGMSIAGGIMTILPWPRVFMPRGDVRPGLQVDSDRLGPGPDSSPEARRRRTDNPTAAMPVAARVNEDARRRYKRDSSRGLDLLEGRQLMATGLLATVMFEAAQVATSDAAVDASTPSTPVDPADPVSPGVPPEEPEDDEDTPCASPAGMTMSQAADQPAPVAARVQAETLYGTANDDFLTKVLYNVPGRMASSIAADGAVGVNATWENGQSTTWYIEQQRYGADFVQAGLVTGKADLARQGWQILDWGFNREAADGSFPTTGDAFHSTSMFVEAAARALLLEVQSGAADADQLVAKYLPKIDASAHWLMTPSVATKGDANDAPYAHRRWLLAAALGQVAKLTGDPATASAAAAYASRGLALQTSAGMNPEKGGGDSSYQAYGILLAERYMTVCQDAGLRVQVNTMIVQGLSWEVSYINAAGQVSTVNNTRTGTEVSRDNTVKTTDYKTIIQALSVATTLTGDPSYRAVAQQVAQGRGWSVK